MQRYLIRIIFLFMLIAQGILSLGQKTSVDSLINILQESDADTLKIAIAKKILIQYVRQKDYNKAEEYAIVFCNLAKKINTNAMLGKAWYNLGIVKWLKKEEVKSNQYFEKSIPYIIATPDSVLLSKCCTKIGTNYLRLAEFTNAIHYYRLSSEVRMGLRDSTGTANNLINIAGCYYQMAEYDNSIRYYHDALKIAEETGNLKLAAYNFNNIGNIYMKTEDYSNAVEYIQKALEVNQKLNDEREISKNLLNIGNTFQLMDDSIRAESYFLESAKIKEKLNDLEGLTATYNSLGSIYKSLGDIEKALIYYHKANDLIQHSHDKFEKASILANIGSIYLVKRQKEAADYFLKSLELAKEIKARQLISSDYSGLIEYYKISGKFELALTYYHLNSLLKDTIYNENTARAIAEMQTKYETEKKEKENEILLKDNRIQKEAKKLLIVVIAGLFLLVASLVYLFVLKSKSLKQNKLLREQERELGALEMAKKEMEKEHLEDKIFAEKQLNKLQRQKFKAELEHKNHELASSALCVVNKNEVLTEIKDKIVSGSIINESENFIPELIRMINHNIDIDQNWQKFKLQFEDIHPGFFDRLKQEHPDLSDIYLKLSAYILIKLTTNEIAQLLNVTTAAVKKSRQRLRKKFDLNAEASLFEFISRI